MPKISALPAGTTPDGTEKVPAVQGGVTVELTASQIAAVAAGHPFVILSTGQSNFNNPQTLAWTPDANVSVWNFSGVDGNIGTAFAAPSGTTINITHKVASDIARANPGRKVYLINVAFSGEDISHWLSGASSPDVYANIVANIAPALAAISATQIDLFLWWQGENDALPSALNTSYVANHATMMTRFWTNSWFPRETPMLLFGIASTAIEGAAEYDQMNKLLIQVVNSDPDKRRYIYPAAFPASPYWTGTNHLSGAGQFSVGAEAANVFLNGPGRGSLYKVDVDPATGDVYFESTTNTSGATVGLVNGALAVQGGGQVGKDLRVGTYNPASGTARTLTIYGAAAGSDAGTSISGFNGTSQLWGIGNASAVFGGAYDGTTVIYNSASAYRFSGLTAGLFTSSANGTVSIIVTGTGVQTALGVNVGSAGAFVTFNGAGGTPSAITLTNGAGLPISTGVSGLGSNVATFLGTASSANLAAALTDEVSAAGVSGKALFGTAGNLPATATNDSASAGNVGEFFEGIADGTAVTFTVTIASPGVFTMVGHTYSNTGIGVFVPTTTGALPTGLTAGTTYYTIPGTISGNTFQVATSVANAVAGTAVNTSGSQSGTHTGTPSVALATGTDKVVAAIRLTAGDWDVSALPSHQAANTTTLTTLQSCISPSLAFDFTPGVGATFTATFPTSGSINTYCHAPRRVSLSSATTYTLIVNDTFGTSTMKGWGYISARRVR